MQTLQTFLTVLYVIICIFLILVVLLQAGKGGGMGAAFGGGGSQSVFGGAGAGNFLTRLTVVNAMLFMMLSATLAYLSSSSDKSLERASEIIRLREEARKKQDAKDAPKIEPAAQSTPEDGTSQESQESSAEESSDRDPAAAPEQPEQPAVD